jgi:hypothetical protein
MRNALKSPAFRGALLLFLTLALPGQAEVETLFRSRGFDFAKLKTAPLEMTLDTTVRLDSSRGLNFFLYDKAYDSQFGSGDSLSRYLSARLAEEGAKRGLKLRMQDTSAGAPQASFRMLVRDLQISQKTEFDVVKQTTRTWPVFSYGVAILDSSNAQVALLKVSAGGTQILAFFEQALLSAVQAGARETAEHLAHARPAPGYVADSVYANRFLVHVEPFKLLPWGGGLPLRLSLGWQAHDKLYMLKASYSHRPFEYVENGGSSEETLGHFWMRTGAGIRFLQKPGGASPFLELDLNFVRWEHKELEHEYTFTGVQPYLYGGYNYIGRRMFFTAGAGAGINLGSHREWHSPDAEFEPVPGAFRYPPIGVLGPLLSLDLEIGAGVFF